MRILEIIHGYPPEYNAGSENYTEAVVNELVRRGHQVAVFCREENMFSEEYLLRATTAGKGGKVSKFMVNIARNKDRFLQKDVDEVLRRIVYEFRPDIAHIEHLNHLSLGIPKILKEKGVPMVYTLHDFWLMCPRGQFLQYNTEGAPWKSCDGQEDAKCATVCYSRYHTGDKNFNHDNDYWTSWISSRMDNARKAVSHIDRFISPSQTVLNTFGEYFPGSLGKAMYLDYGFDRSKLADRARNMEENGFVFGYIGTHIPAKGIDYLIRAFGSLKGETVLRIWGRHKGELTPHLMKMATELEKTSGKKIEWMGEFDSDKIVEQVFNNVDAIVVPSIWLENSPLVIHEAQQVRVPVVTADAGGMAEYVEHESNGLLFSFRDEESLSAQMQRLVDNPDLAVELGKSGYKYSSSGDVPSIEEHVDELVELFQQLIISGKDHA